MYDKQARCWKGYEPVPGKEPYSNDSCRPIGSSKKKKKEVKKTVKKAESFLGCLRSACDNSENIIRKEASNTRVLQNVLIKTAAPELQKSVVEETPVNENTQYKPTNAYDKYLHNVWGTQRSPDFLNPSLASAAAPSVASAAQPLVNTAKTNLTNIGNGIKTTGKQIINAPPLPGTNISESGALGLLPALTRQRMRTKGLEGALSPSLMYNGPAPGGGILGNAVAKQVQDRLNQGQFFTPNSSNSLGGVPTSKLLLDYVANQINKNVIAPKSGFPRIPNFRR